MCCLLWAALWEAPEYHPQGSSLSSPFSQARPSLSSCFQDDANELCFLEPIGRHSMWELVQLSQLSPHVQCSLSVSYLPVTSPTSEIQFAISALLSFVLTSWCPSVSRISCWGRLIDSSGNMAAELQTKSRCLRSSRLGLAFVIRMYKGHYLVHMGKLYYPVSTQLPLFEKKTLEEIGLKGQGTIKARKEFYTIGDLKRSQLSGLGRRLTE